MSLKIGIVGLPNVGKSTLFKAITKKQVDCSNYPFCTIEPNVGIVEVLDKRVDKLAELSHSAKKIYATVEFVDIAGLVKGANEGEGLGNKFLANIREVAAVIYVLRCFRNEKVVNTQPKVDVLAEKETLDTEMALKDLETVEKRIKNLEKNAKAGEKLSQKELEFLQNLKELLQKGKDINRDALTPLESKLLKSYQLLSFKPKLYLLNGGDNEVEPSLRKVFQDNQWPFLVIDVLTEFEAADLSPDEKKSFGLPPTLKLDTLIENSYKLLNLITFFTTGADETRAWTLKRGGTAPQAGGVIHSDFEKYFIKAEVINWQKLVQAGGFSIAREQGLVRTEGKQYIVQDGDVIEIKSGA